MRVVMNTRQFQRELTQIINYSAGFLEGVQAGKTKFFINVGTAVVEILKEYIDATARANPAMLHHIYEWNQIGEKQARLYNVTFTISNLGLSFLGNLKQSTSIKEGSKVPFYDKAIIMEEGRSVIIEPKESPVLAYKVNGEQVVTSSPSFVENPGGPETTGGFQKVFDEFFNKYFSQAFFRSTGIAQYLQNPVTYKKNLYRAKRGGKSAGREVGYRWVANAGRGVK